MQRAVLVFTLLIGFCAVNARGDGWATVGASYGAPMKLGGFVQATWGKEKLPAAFVLRAEAATGGGGAESGCGTQAWTGS
jgi:hypothetical protein